MTIESKATVANIEIGNKKIAEIRRTHYLPSSTTPILYNSRSHPSPVSLTGHLKTEVAEFLLIPSVLVQAATAKSHRLGGL